MAAEAGYKGYQENGMLGAVNAFNPAYHAMAAGYQAMEAWERSDYYTAGYQGRERVETYEARIGEQLCVIREAFKEHMALVMSNSGVVYAAYDDTLVRVGQSGEDAIEALCTGKELEHIP
jgi:hypothetical protein